MIAKQKNKRKMSLSHYTTWTIPWEDEKYKRKPPEMNSGGAYL